MQDKQEFDISVSPNAIVRFKKQDVALVAQKLRNRFEKQKQLAGHTAATIIGASLMCASIFFEKRNKDISSAFNDAALGALSSWAGRQSYDLAQEDD